MQMNGDSITTQPAVYWLNNPFDLNDVDHYGIDQPQTIRQWLDSNGGDTRLNYLPTVCVMGGKELLRAEYDQPIDGPVCFVTLPTGGDSGSNPLAAIAMIMVAVYAPVLAGKMGATFATTVKGVTTLTTAGQIASGVIMLGGAMLINMVFPPPGLPNSASPSAGSPTYSLGAQGNAARLGAPIPVNYGKMRIYPDFAAQPYSEYESNEQYLYQLFCIGQGQNQLSDLRLEDTPIENFAEVTTEIIPPLGKVTLFHTAVVTAPEAGGQDMTDPITLGPYVLNAVETEVSRIAVDVVFPGGLMGVDEDDGDEYSVAVHLNITAETIDDDGNPTGGGVTIFNSSISDCTRTAIRRTLAADVAPGRYRVTVSRTTGKGPDHEVRNCSLGAVKGYLVDDNEYGDVTLLAMRVRASANLSDSAARMVNVLTERLIPVWSPEGWSQPRLTRNPAWAFADAVRSRYGGDFADSELDLEGLLYLAGLFDSRGDRFDGRFDTEQSLWDGLGKIGQVCRSGPVRQGNLIRLIRDQHIEAPAQVFGMANMTDFSVDYVMHDDRTADAVKITYWDETRDYSETTITCQLPDDTADNPQEVTLFGCTGYEQAWREGMYLAASNRERRQMVSWTTGLEGHIPTFGDLVIINHDLMGAGHQFGGIVEAVDGAVLTLSSDIEADGEHWYCILRDRYGEPSAPLPIEVVAPNRVRVLDTLPYIETDTSREPTHYLIGQGAKVSWPVKVTAINPEADNKITIAGCIESEFVHTVDQGVLPPPPPEIKPPPPGLVINNLLATQGGTVHAPVLFLSWDIAKGADRYLIEYSTDGRETWQPAGTGQSFINQHEFAAEVGLMTCRVAAVGAIRGEWADISLNAGGDFDTPGKVQPVLVEPFTGDALKVRWDKQPAAARYVLRVISRGTGVRSVYLERNITEYHYFYTDAQQDAAGRTLTIKVAAENGNGVLGDYGELTATNPPPAVPDNVEVTGLLNTIMVQCTQPADTDLRELRVYGEQRSGFTPSPANLLATSQNALLSVTVPTDTQWWVRLAWVDQWGATDLNFSGEFEAEASQILETVIGPDSIETPMLKANAVVADKIAANAVTVEKLAANVADFIVANIGDGNITNAMIGNFIQSNNYQEGVSGWHISKLGFAEFQDVTVRGKIVGSIIEGSFIVEGSTQWYTATEADTGIEPRYFTYATPIQYSKTITMNLNYSVSSIVEVNRPPTFNTSFYEPDFPVLPADYTGDGTEDIKPADSTESVTIYSGLNRLKLFDSRLSLDCSGTLPYNRIHYQQESEDVQGWFYLKVKQIQIQLEITQGTSTRYTGLSDWISIGGTDTSTTLLFNNAELSINTTGSSFDWSYNNGGVINRVYVPTGLTVSGQFGLSYLSGNEPIEVRITLNHIRSSGHDYSKIGDIRRIKGQSGYTGTLTAMPHIFNLER